MRRVIMAFCLCLSCGCSSPTDPAETPVLLFVDQAVAAAGDTVVLRLVNASRGAVGYNLCSAVLQRRGPAGWHSAERGRLCQSVQYGLAPRSQGTGSRVIPRGLLDGEYRFVTDVASSTTRRVTIFSNSFQVQ